MASELDSIETLLKAMRDRGAEMDAFKGLMTRIAQGLADIVSLMEKPKESPVIDLAPLAEAISSSRTMPMLPAPTMDMGPLAEAFRSISIPAPVINMPAMTPAAAISGWRVTVMSRDELGRMKELAIKAE